MWIILLIFTLEIRAETFKKTLIHLKIPRIKPLYINTKILFPQKSTIFPRTTTTKKTGTLALICIFANNFNALIDNPWITLNLLLCSIFYNMLFWLKYIKKIQAHKDM